MKLREKLAAVIATVVLGGTSAAGQTNPNLESGFHNFGSYHGGDVGVVDLVHGGLNVRIPVSSFPQRSGRMAVERSFMDTGKKWGVQEIHVPIVSGIGFNTVHPWTPAGTTGITSNTNMVVGRTRTVTNDPNIGIIEADFNYWVRTPDGSMHNLDGQRANGTPDGIFLSVDTSGLQFTVTRGVKPDHSDDSGVLTDRHGTHYYYPKISVLAGNIVSANIWLTGYTFSVWDGDPRTVTTHNDMGYPATVVDANGNTLSPGLGPGLGQDTLGRSVVGPFLPLTSTSDYTGCNSSHAIVSAGLLNDPGLNGAAYTVKLCYATFTIATAFSQPANAQQYPNLYAAGPWTMLVSIVLPDGRSWSLDYDGYGNITSIGYPTGGGATYQWQEIAMPFCNDGSGTPVSRAVISRTESDGVTQALWQYSWGQRQSDGTISNIVIDPAGNETVHVVSPIATLCGFYETQTRHYQGSHTSGTLLKTVDTAYSGSVGNLNYVPTNVVPTTITTTLPNGKVSQVTRQYDSGIPGTPQAPSGVTTFGNVVLETVTDWAQGAPGPVLRQTATTYQWQVDTTGNYLNAGLLDLPASVIVKDGSGNRVSETDYFYDESQYLTASGITTQHGAPPGPVRGNPTTTSQWLNTTNSLISSHTNWYDTGEVYQTIDPLGHTTTLSYDSAYAGAYVTQTCSPQTGTVTHCVSGTYDFNTGLMTSLSNENAATQASGNTPGDAAHTTTYSYDQMLRMTSAVSPPDPSNGNAHAQTSFNYSAANSFPLNVQRQRSVTNALTDSVTSYFDGLGRAFKTEHTTIGATVDTTYDNLGQVASVSNPHLSSTSPTDGVIQTQYDALGRVIQITKQDGGISTVDYSQPTCPVATDEAGKQRKSCSDALGRLIEVDEPGDDTSAAASSGALIFNGALQSWTDSAHPASQGHAELTFSGTLQSLASCSPSGQPCSDSGSIIITLAGVTKRVTYNASTGTNPGQPVQALASAFHGDASSPVDAVYYGADEFGNYVMDLIARTTGAATNYPMSVSVVSDNAANFTPPSFQVSAGSSLIGGKDASSGGTVYDSGVIYVSVGTYTASATYSHNGNNTASMVASALAGSGATGLNGSSSPVTAIASGSSLTLAYKAPGAAGNVSVSVDSSSADPDNPSFTSAGTVLAGGADPQPGSLASPYVTLYAYDTLGNLLRVDQKGSAPSDSTKWRTRTFTYDSLSRLLTAQNPESGLISYAYDADGELLMKTSPAPNQTASATQTVSYCYDELHRVTKRDYSSHTYAPPACPITAPIVSYVYDSGANAKGHLTSLTDQAGSGSYNYDVLGRMAGESRTIAGVTKSMSYGYNLDGSIKTITHPSNSVVTYTPDAAGRMVSAGDLSNGINYVSGATYGPAGAIAGFVSGQSLSFGGITNTFMYNNRLQPCRMTASSTGAIPTNCDNSWGNLLDLRYDFHWQNGDNGNVYGIINYRDQSRNQTFAYDALNRLTSAQNAGTDCNAAVLGGKTKFWGNAYGYDAWGNLRSKTVTKCSAENLSVTVGNDNRLQGGYTYDAAGNMTFDPTDGVTATYDAENRIATATKGGVTTTYTYDDGGNRVKKSTGSAGTLYWYMSPGIVAESDLSGVLQSEYVFFGGERVARRDGPTGAGGVFYYFSDHLKTASVITDSAGVIKAESDYYPWGGELQFVNNDSNHYKFTGKERDLETGLDYFGARYYSSGQGRFISADWSAAPEPVPYADFTNPQTLNLYRYPSNPETYPDRDGHEDAKTKAARQRAVRQAWSQEKARVASGKQGTVKWTAAEKAELLKTTRVSGYKGHHINNVADHPELAGEPNNIKFTKEHLAEHQGNWQNETSGNLMNRAFIGLQLAGIAVDFLKMEKFNSNTPQTGLTMGAFGIVTISNVDTAAQTLTPGTQTEFDGQIFTLTRDHKWEGPNGNTIYYDSKDGKNHIKESGCC